MTSMVFFSCVCRFYNNPSLLVYHLPPSIVDPKDPIEKLYEYSTLFGLCFPMTIKQVAVIYREHLAESYYFIGETQTLTLFQWLYRELEEPILLSMSLCPWLCSLMLH